MEWKWEEKGKKRRREGYSRKVKPWLEERVNRLWERGLLELRRDRSG